MRIYRVEATSAEGEHRIKFAGTQADARQAKAQLVIELGVKKKDVETKEVEVPVAKPKFLEFINGFVAEIMEGDE